MPRFFHSKINLDANDQSKMTFHKRSLSRNKSSSHVVENPTVVLSENAPHARIVRIRLVFIRIGEIDTLNEKYQAEVYYEARWYEKINIHTLNLTLQQQSQLLNESSTVRVNDYNPIIYWTPQLFIENAIGQIGEQEKWFTLKRSSGEKTEPLSPPIINLEICEHRRVKGVFWEKLELNHFPADVQDLTVSITTHHHNDVCVLVQDEQLRSSINREAFFDQQEWNLYEHVATEVRQSMEEYSFDDENGPHTPKHHSVLAVTCRAARRPGYYYWNGFCLIFLITLCSFCIFSIPPDLPQNRLQITCTLLLTSVTFRWVVNRSLPTISYLTTLDKYAIISIVILVVLCIWHSIIATITFANPSEIVKGTKWNTTYVQIDRYVFIAMFVFYVFIHIALIIWLVCVPYKRRREMEYLDRQYAAKKHIQLDTSRSRYASSQSPTQDLIFRRAPSMQSMVSMIKTPSSMIRGSERPIIISNSTTFLPIREETNKMENVIEVQEQDDVFYDHTNDINAEQKSTQVRPAEKI